jgi:iron-sulfur cluster protein
LHFSKEVAVDRKFRRRINEAVQNPQLRLALRRATETFGQMRASGMAGLDLDKLRRELRAIKEEAIADLPRLAQRFREEAEGTGAVVYQAADAADANRFAVEIARQRGTKLAVKSKSMVTEEIELNQQLAAAGVEVVETDLGEWIIQLAGERPSHLVGPALHKTREEIAQLFTDRLGEEVPAQAQALVKVAQRRLRRYFVEADMGISGANAALAETGTLLIVTNEGNSRLVTTLPPVHLAFLGYEKILPGLREAAVLLQLLSRSAGGQKMTAYVSYITGPSRTVDIELTPVRGVHGPGEVYIILLDNGRWRMWEDPQFREALYCIKCGACLNVCPVFRLVGGHVFGHIYTGGIGCILTAFHHGLKAAADPTQLCIGCGQCVEVCPTLVDTPRMVLALKERMATEQGLPRGKSILHRHILPHPKRLRLALAGAQRLPGWASPFSGDGAWPRPTGTSFQQRFREARLVNARGRVAFYCGCLMEHIYPEMAEAVVESLKRCGLEVLYPQGQVCCGAPAIFDGDRQGGLSLARRNISALEGVQADHIITACPSCSLVLRQQYPRLMAGDRTWERRAQAIAAKIRDFSPFILDARSTRAGVRPSPGLRTVTYHDSCHLKRSLGVSQEPRRLLAEAGYQVVEMAGADSCCGFGGYFSLEYPQLSRAILEQKLEAIEATGADLVATDCPGCILHIGEGLRRRGNPIQVRHTAQLLL